MTDDEIREALRLDFEQTADWRRSKAAEHPEDSRNLEAAALLDKLAASVETVAPDLLDAYGSLRDDYMDSEQHSERFRQIGFGPKQPKSLLRRASPTGQRERKVRERRRRGRPSEDDLRAIHQFVRSPGPAGEPAPPRALPPGQQPDTPTVDWPILTS